MTKAADSAKSRSRLVYFTGLQLENVRSFGDAQELCLIDENRRLTRWTLIIGENNTGKTTLLQYLARMRPETTKPGENDPETQETTQPVWMEPDADENKTIRTLARTGSSDIKMSIKATLSVGHKLEGRVVRGA